MLELQLEMEQRGCRIFCLRFKHNWTAKCSCWIYCTSSDRSKYNLYSEPMQIGTRQALDHVTMVIHEYWNRRDTTGYTITSGLAEYC